MGGANILIQFGCCRLCVVFAWYLPRISISKVHLWNCCEKLKRFELFRLTVISISSDKLFPKYLNENFLCKLYLAKL